jgi:DNA-binding GntR family transcriptional regulator
MSGEHRPKLDEKSERVLRWLYEHRGDFEGAGVAEASLAGATGLSEAEVTDAVDHLESREALARIPQHGAGFLLQPARGWEDVCEEFGVSQAEG